MANIKSRFSVLVDKKAARYSELL